MTVGELVNKLMESNISINSQINVEVVFRDSSHSECVKRVPSNRVSIQTDVSPVVIRVVMEGL